MPQFNRYIGIDYSGAVTPESSCKGLRVTATAQVAFPTTTLASFAVADKCPSSFSAFHWFWVQGAGF